MKTFSLDVVFCIFKTHSSSVHLVAYSVGLSLVMLYRNERLRWFFFWLQYVEPFGTFRSQRKLAAALRGRANEEGSGREGGRGVKVPMRTYCADAGHYHPVTSSTSPLPPPLTDVVKICSSMHEIRQSLPYQCCTEFTEIIYRQVFTIAIFTGSHNDSLVFTRCASK